MIRGIGPVYAKKLVHAFGLTATARLRSDPATAQVPVLALSAAGGPFTSDAAKDAGCDAFLAKPVTPDALLEHLRAAFATLQQKRTSR